MDEYNNGWIYSPRSGSNYTARMTLKDRDTLDLHGYVLVPFLGESQSGSAPLPMRQNVRRRFHE